MFMASRFKVRLILCVDDKHINEGTVTTKDVHTFITGVTLKL